MERVARIEAVCRAHDVPLAAAALQFVLGHPAVVTVIPGGRSRAEVEQNATWVSLDAPRAILARPQDRGAAPVRRAGADLIERRADRISSGWAPGLLAGESSAEVGSNPDRGQERIKESAVEDLALSALTLGVAWRS